MRSLLGSEGVHTIHNKTVELLETVGVAVQDDGACDLLARAGAHVSGRQVKIPRQLVNQAIESAPRQVTIYDRMGKARMVLGGDNVYFGTGSDTPYVIDPLEGTRRQARKFDCARGALVADALSDIDFVMSFGLAYDVPTETSDLHQFEAMVMNTTKPIVFTAHSEAGFQDIVQMASWALPTSTVQERPYVILYAEPSSPLQHSSDALRKLMAAARAGIPVVYTSAVLLGGTGPVTLAGGLVLANAESLSGLVIHQLAGAGAPFIYGCGTPAMDMVTGACSYGSPELHLGNAAAKELARHYQLPTFSAAGCTDSPVFDQQAAFEAAFSIMMAVSCGSNLVHDVGFLASGTTACLEFLVSCSEFIRLARAIGQGIRVDEETLAAEVIKQVGAGGSFLAHPHTLRFARESLWRSKLYVRQNYDRWYESGAHDLAERARAEVQRIVENHRPSEIGEEGKRLIRNLVERRDAAALT